ncbi:secreted RxLR effector peptide protein, putative [Phytophthora infestans T30-4]|uniref:RxLR effector protein n=1 Tax=Phytophthora infestans (strain T30-4) TaxID=403677 RepID=D0NTB4_PHYIT|nr:secreted RxLR effector peptide protein, putative [Phytophthora infestans T30-4]EEY64865.1 secreted RxLR effector peptide protein, putative [Phytophthora infestans T30-4]|eukprot:XP_002897595.1 secreted RxLR effector peptide protein, putative [Phytophthora infestans T30-4]
MRFTYILTAVFLATLYASSTALPVKNFKTIIKNKSPLDPVDSVNVNDGRLLRGLVSPASDGNGIEEERFLTSLFQALARRMKRRTYVAKAGKQEQWLARLRKKHGVENP